MGVCASSEHAISSSSHAAKLDIRPGDRVESLDLEEIGRVISIGGDAVQVRGGDGTTFWVDLDEVFWVDSRSVVLAFGADELRIR